MTTDRTSSGEVTEMLVALRGGDEQAFDRRLPLVYEELRRVAVHQLRRHRSSATLGATDLVHEAYMKMADQKGLEARDRGHFLAIAARAMRQLIVDRARKRNAEKRGGSEAPVSLDQAPEPGHEPAWLLDLDQALDRLPSRLARVVECRFFAGYSEEETAEAMGSSLRTVQRDWKRARAWLREELAGSAGDSG